jgi:hypothetical protein
MPRPAYFACSFAGAVDTYNNSVSAFGMIETISVQKVDPRYMPLVQMFSRPPLFRVVVAWLREQHELADQVYEAHLVACLSDRTEIVLATFDAFSFTTPFHRLVVTDFALPPVPGPGILVLECRLRKKGDTDWAWGQTYPILLEEGPTFVLPQLPEGSSAADLFTSKVISTLAGIANVSTRPALPSPSQEGPAR